MSYTAIFPHEQNLNEMKKTFHGAFSRKNIVTLQPLYKSSHVGR